MTARHFFYISVRMTATREKKLQVINVSTANITPKYYPIGLINDRLDLSLGVFSEIDLKRSIGTRIDGRGNSEPIRTWTF